MVFIETAPFQRSAAKLLDDDDVAALQTMLMLRPDAGVVIPAGGGLRKVRVPAKGKGKSGGARIIYYWIQADDQILLVYAYAKNVQADLTKQQLKQLRQLVAE